MVRNFAFYLYCAALVLPYAAVATGIALLLMPRRSPSARHTLAHRTV